MDVPSARKLPTLGTRGVREGRVDRVSRILPLRVWESTAGEVGRVGGGVGDRERLSFNSRLNRSCTKSHYGVV